MTTAIHIQKAIGRAILEGLKDAGVPPEERKKMAMQLAQTVTVSFFDEVEGHVLKLISERVAGEVMQEPGNFITREDVGTNPYKVLAKELARVEQRRRTWPESVGRSWAALVKKHQKIAMTNCMEAAGGVLQEMLGDSYKIEVPEVDDREPDEVTQQVDELMKQMAEVQQVADRIERLKVQASEALRCETAKVSLRFAGW